MGGIATKFGTTAVETDVGSSAGMRHSRTGNCSLMDSF